MTLKWKTLKINNKSYLFFGESTYRNLSNINIIWKSRLCRTEFLLTPTETQTKYKYAF